MSGNDPVQRGMPRRRFMKLGVYVLGAGGIAAACGDDAAAPAPTTTAAPSGTAAPTTTAAAATTTAAPATTAAPTTTAAAGPPLGGVLRLGTTGAGPRETVDPHAGGGSNANVARKFNLHARLQEIRADMAVENTLAEIIEPNADGSAYTIRLIDGAEFHHGKSIEAEDVMFSIQRMAEGGIMRDVLELADVANIRIVDRLTIELPMLTPAFVYSKSWGELASGIAPTDYDPETNPAGSGPFKLVDWVPGEETILGRHENYFGDPGSGGPYLDEVRLISFSDDLSRTNALLSGQIDAMDSVPIGQIPVVEGTDGLAVLEAEAGRVMFFYMRNDRPPFDDVRVRQAIRLIADRSQMVNQALSGRGAVANDLFSPFDPCYASEIPQRTQDIAEARRLLEAAGQSGLTIDLNVSPVIAGVVEAAQVLAQQATEAGVTINVVNLDPGDYYASWPDGWEFGFEFFANLQYPVIAPIVNGPGAFFNMPAWEDQEWLDLLLKARTEPDDEARCNIFKEMQALEHERGGYLIWGRANITDGYSTAYDGFVSHRLGRSFGQYDMRPVHQV